MFPLIYLSVSVEISGYFTTIALYYVTISDKASPSFPCPLIEMENNTWLPEGGLSPMILVKREGQVPSTCCSSQTGTGANIPLSQTLSPALTETVREPHSYHSHLPAVLASLTLFPLRIPEIVSCCPFSFMPILSSQPQTLHLYFEPSVVYTSPSLPSSTHLQLLSLSTEIRGIHCLSPVTSSRSSVF